MILLELLFEWGFGRLRDEETVCNIDEFTALK